MRTEGVLVLISFAALASPIGCLNNRCLELGECHFPDDEGLLYPLQDGAWWRMQVTTQQSNSIGCPDKLVSVGPRLPIPLRDTVEAYQVYSRRGDEWAIRWQEVLEDGSVVRHIDEWYRLPFKENPTAADRNSITYYCPAKERAMDGRKACECGDWESVRWELMIELNTTNREDWTICEAIVVDQASCIPLGEVPGVCDTGREQVYEVFVVEAVAAPVPLPVLATNHRETTKGVLPALQVYSYEEREDGPLDWDVFSWYRGLGKIAKDDGEDWDELVDFCLPDRDGQTYEACMANKPTKSDLEALCP